MKNAEVLARYLWAAFIVGGCAYIVFGLGHSGWWFLLALVLIA